MQKKELYMLIKKQLEENVDHLISQIKSLKISRDKDTKSSMGDKYETGRAMIQIEMDKMDKRLFDAQQMLYVFKNLNIDQKEGHIKSGSLIDTNYGMFFMSIGLGKINKIEKENVFALSPSSPLGRKFLTKKKGQTFCFQQRNYKIIDVI